MRRPLPGSLIAKTVVPFAALSLPMAQAHPITATIDICSELFTAISSSDFGQETFLEKSRLRHITPRHYFSDA